MAKSKTKPVSSGKLSSVLQMLMPLLLIALGVLLIMQRNALNSVFSSIGIFLALLGLICVVIYCATKQYEKKPPYLVMGIGLLLFGGIFIAIPFFADQLIPFCIGLFILINGISGIRDAWQMKRISSSWQVLMVFAVLITLMGIATLVCAFHLSGVVWVVIGVLLIISGAMRLFNAFLSLIARTKQKKHSGDVISAEATEV